MLQEITDSQKLNEIAHHVCQSWQWGEFRKTTISIKKVARLGIGPKVWQIFFSRVPYLSSKTIAYLPRGVMPTSSELEEIKKYCLKEHAIFLKIEPMTETQSFKNPEFVNGKSILPKHTILVDLTLSEDELLNRMHEKTRYNIRLAQKKGVIVKEENSSEALENFIKVLEDTEKRQGFYSHNSDYYRKLWNQLRPHQMVFLLNAYAPIEGRLVYAAGVMLFRFKDFLYYPYGGSDYKFRQFMAPQLLHFEAMKLGKKLDCKTYDLWGSYKNSPTESDPWWGFYRLKSGLGGREVNFPETIDIPLSPLYKPLMIADDLRWKLLRLKKKF